MFPWAPTLQIQIPNLEEGEISGFYTNEVLLLEEDGCPDINSIVANIIQKINFFPGVGLGHH